MLKILHLTDLHYRPTGSSRVRQDRIVNKILEGEKEEQFDLLLFTGDLVFSGTRLRDFTEAKESLLDRFSKQYNIPAHNVFLCPGNHDIDRQSVRKSVLRLMDEEINDEYALNQFVKSNDEDFKDSFQPLSNYIDFIKSDYKSDYVKFGDKINNLYSTHVRSVDDTKIGIVSINIAWRAIGDKDRGNLMFPVEQLEEAIFDIKDADLKILIHHHPFSYLKEFNEYSLEDVIHNNFDLSFSGHRHKNSNQINLTANDGIVKIAGPASLAPEGSEIGYSTYNLDLGNLSLEENVKLFDVKNEVLYDAKKQTIEIPSDQVRQKQNKFRQTLRKKFELELENANDLFVANRRIDSKNSFLEIYTTPVLKSKSYADISSSEEVEEDFNIELLIETTDDFIVLGKDKCGKTSLLKKIQLELLRGFSRLERIPYYIDSKESANIDVLKEFRRYFEINRNEAERILNESNILFLIDNFDQSNVQLVDSLKEYLNKPNASFILVIDETMSQTIDDFKLGDRYFAKLYFRKLRKKHIRMLADKWPNIDDTRKEEIVEKIESIFTRMSIPFNFWTVSLFLWVFKEGSTTNFQNDVGLVDLYIESLLERDNLIKSQASFGFDKYKKYLASLAHFLFINHQSELYSATYLEIIHFTDDYLKENPRYDIETKHVWDYIEDKGIIKKREDSRYTFRLNGVFEYFLAYHMKINDKFRQQCVESEDLYLSFSNEFELYAGFVKDDKDFLKAIFNNTKRIFSKIDERYKDGTSIDNHLLSKIYELRDFEKTIKTISENAKTLSFEEQDMIEEQSLAELGVTDEETDVKLKKREFIDNTNPESLEESLKILGRVFKNIDEIDEQQLVYEIFDYIIDHACFWGYDLIDSFKEDMKENYSDEDDHNKTLIRILTSFIPTLVQTTLNDMIGHRNIQKLIKERIKKMKADYKQNQYRLFLLYYLLADISLIENRNFIKESIELITIPTLKYSILLKLNYYYAFKGNLDKELSKDLYDLIQKQQFNFDKESSLDMFQKSMNKKEKAIRVNKAKD